ncbi:MAG: flagellar filament capping protein FliD [Lachnospiraceae bacterium]|nr:flagellar filament capping protein FliD [Lachnospiraceae bacterium]
MAIRMSGLMSGLDTEAIVGALMSAQSLKKTKVVQAKTKLEWKQTIWADLNTKLMKLYNEQVSKMQLSTAYTTKKATVSDPSKAKITAGAKAVNGNYTLEVNNVATTQYLTGAKIGAKSVNDKLTDIDPSLLNKEITITSGGKTSKFTVTADSTISDFTQALKDAGLNASYDTTQRRFFISSKDSGLSNAFSITTTSVSDAELNGSAALKEALGYDKMSSANKKIVDETIEKLKASGVDTEEHDNKAFNAALDALAKASYDNKKSEAALAAKVYVGAQLYDGKYAEIEAETREKLKADYYDEEGNLLEGKTEEDYEKEVATQANKDTIAYVNGQMKTEEVQLQVEAAAFSGVSAEDIEALGDKAKERFYKDGITGFEGTENLSEESEKEALREVANAYAGIDNRSDELASSALGSLGLADIAVDEEGNVTVNGGANDKTNGAIPDGMALIAASDSEILLNGAKLTSSTSTVTVNGLNIELTGKTKEDEPITFTVGNDVDGVYDSIKNFLKEYNDIMKEMYHLYNADSAKGYEPLTSEQKEAMSEEEVKLWEEKIKGSLLRNDSTLSGIMQSMRSAMQGTVQYNGKNYSLSTFGIMTGTDWTEGGQLHIFGDSEDSVYSSRDDKLKKALEEDPDAVIATLTGIFGNLRQTMSQKMSAVPNYSSALTFYNDIKMKSDMRNYEKDIDAWETKLADMEESYYKKFTAMETALAKLQSQQSSLAGLLGGGN